MPTPMGGEAGATLSRHPPIAAAAPVNVPLALRTHPNALQMSRKYRRAAEAGGAQEGRHRSVRSDGGDDSAWPPPNLNETGHRRHLCIPIIAIGLSSQASFPRRNFAWCGCGLQGGLEQHESREEMKSTPFSLSSSRQERSAITLNRSLVPTPFL